MLLSSMVSTRRIHDDVPAEIRRLGRFGAAALVAIPLTVLAVTVVEGAGTWLVSSAVIAVSLEIVVVLGILHRMSARLERQARGMDDQRRLVADQAGQLQAQSMELAQTARDVRAANTELEIALHDARQSHAAAEAVARQKTRLAALLEAALAGTPVGFAFYDTQLRFLRVNATLAALNGVAPEDHIGLTLQDIDEKTAAVVEPLLRRVLETGQPIRDFEMQSDVPRDPGSMRDWLLTLYPVVAGGEVVGIGSSVTELTERKQLEAQLFQAQKMEAVGRLAGGIAHDFNNLLTVISNYTELILANPDIDESRRELHEIRDAAARAAVLTRQLLVFSRKKPLQPRIINPNEVVLGIQGMLRRVLLENVEVVTHLDPSVSLVRVDVGQFEQVLMNLSINAADAMPQGGRLTISTQNVEIDGGFTRRQPALTPGPHVRIEVTDTGHGMDAATMKQMFEPFFTTKEAGRGTGLGLSIVYGILKQSGGHVTVTSKLGTGTTFHIYLPAALD